jgi:hypothetical protein
MKNAAHDVQSLAPFAVNQILPNVGKSWESTEIYKMPACVSRVLTGMVTPFSTPYKTRNASSSAARGMIRELQALESTPKSDPVSHGRAERIS